MNGFVQCLRFLVFLSLKMEGNIRENSKNRKVRRVADRGRCMERRSKGRNPRLLY